MWHADVLSLQMEPVDHAVLAPQMRKNSPVTLTRAASAIPLRTERASSQLSKGTRETTIQLGERSEATRTRLEGREDIKPKSSLEDIAKQWERWRDGSDADSEWVIK